MSRGSAGRPQKTIKTGETFALAEWFNKNVDHLTDLTNEELAAKLGYTRPNIISMWRTGRTKIPLDRLAPLCDALKVDLAYLLPLWIEQYGGAEANARVLKVLRNTVSDSEMALVETARQITAGRDFALKPDAFEKLREVVEKD
jgi:DNA-binding Xre family transcriptional regulator